MSNVKIEHTVVGVVHSVTTLPRYVLTKVSRYRRVVAKALTDVVRTLETQLTFAIRERSQLRPVPGSHFMRRSNRARHHPLRRVRRSIAVLLGCSLTLLAASCGGSAGSTGSGDQPEIELTIATFNEFGYADLYDEYEAEHPNIQIIERHAETVDAHIKNLDTNLASGSGMADIEAMEVSWIYKYLAHGRPVRRSARLRRERPQGPLAGLEGRRRHHPGRPDHRLRHRHRAGGDLLPPGPVRQGRACRPTGSRWPSCSRTGRRTSRPGASSRRRCRARPGTTRPC